MDGRLYVVLNAENIHPGKGTPVSQIEMRRISDGTKVSERFKTTDQVERAFVEDRDFNYLYQDGEGFHFMNNETYDQVAVTPDVIGTFQGKCAELWAPTLALIHIFEPTRLLSNSYAGFCLKKKKKQ